MKPDVYFNMPFLGEVPGNSSQIILAGSSGHSMPLILLSAKAIAQTLLHKTPFEETGVLSIKDDLTTTRIAFLVPRSRGPAGKILASFNHKQLFRCMCGGLLSRDFKP